MRSKFRLLGPALAFAVVVVVIDVGVMEVAVTTLVDGPRVVVTVRVPGSKVVVVCNSKQSVWKMSLVAHWLNHPRLGTAPTECVKAGTVYFAVCIGPGVPMVVVVVVREPGNVTVHDAAGTVVVITLPDPVITTVLVES